MAAQDTLTIQRQLKVNVHDCPTCGVFYGLLDDYEARHRSYKTSWYCPSGHEVVPGGPADVELVKAQLDRAQTALADARSQVAMLERSRAAAQGEFTKLKKRAAAGCCPCCHRTFANMARHMQSKHQAFVNAGNQ